MNRPQHSAAPHRAPGRSGQRGGFIIGMLVGIVVGLAIAVVTAMVVNQTSIPFLASVQKSAESPPVTAASEAAKGRADPEALPDPNRTVESTKARPSQGAATSPGGRSGEDPERSVPDATAGTAPTRPAAPPLPPPSVINRPADASADAPRGGQPGAPIESARPSSTDATGAGSPAASASAGSTAQYMLQAGAFRSQGDADAMRARLMLMGEQAQIQQATVNGSPLYRVRMGPYDGLDAMNQARARLADNDVEATVLRLR